MNRIGSQMLKSLFAVCLVVGLSSTLVGCEDDETNAIAKAQECLDNARGPNADTLAAACRGLISDKSSQQAMILRCSIEFVAGGLTTSKVADALKGGEDQSEADKEANLIGLLALGSTATADAAVTLCNQTGIDGLMYLANLSLIGTYMLAAGGSASDPDTFLTNCYNGGAGGVCNDTTIGIAVMTLGDSACDSEDADDEVCDKVNQAIAAGGGNPDAVAQNLYNLLNNP